MSRRIRIGLVAWNALPAIVDIADDRSTQTFGGMETAMWTLARQLAKHDDVEVVAFVAADSPRNGDCQWPSHVDDVVLQVRDDRYRRIRRHVSDCFDFATRRFKRFDRSLLWQLPLLAVTKPFRTPDALPRQADPRLSDPSIDYWIAFGNSEDTSRVIARAMADGKPCAISIQSNIDLDPRLAEKVDDGEVNDYGESDESRRFALRHASEIWCQTSTQMNVSEDVFGLPSYLVRNPIDISEWAAVDDQQRQEVCSADRVLWIGRYDDFHKRPLLMLEAARACPEVPFTMIINPLDPDIEERVKQEKPDNVDIVDRVPFKDMPAVFQQARLFVSTGATKYEGFPNVLLQAAAAGTSIVSLVDHDQFIERSGAGVACDQSLDLFVQSIRQYWQSDPVDHDDVSSYLMANHDSRAVAKLVRDRIVESITEMR